MREVRGELELSVWVTPGAARDEVRGVVDGRLRVRLAAPPREGRANAALVAFVAETVGVAPSRVTLLRGAGSRRKIVTLRGVGLEEARRRLGL